MNPTTNEAPSLNLPPPVMAESLPSDPNRAPLGPAEAAPRVDHSLPAANPQLPLVSLPVPAPLTSTIAVGSVSNTTSNANPSVAEDADLIEKVWVQKAKDLIKKTQSDPHIQSREVNIFKADYMQKRYNKVLKLSE